MFVHLAVKSVWCPGPLHHHEAASPLWATLRRTFPQALGCTIMPEHVHLVTPTESPDLARRRAAAALAGLRRATSTPKVAAVEWAPVARPQEIPDRLHLRRLVRYLALNPSRRRLVRDPLEWLWSTHRDVVGAVVDPWVDVVRLAAALGRPTRGFAERHHEYVSGDPTVRVAGTPFPQPARTGSASAHPIRWVVAAAAAATRSHAEATRRRGRARELFVQLALHVGWSDPVELAEHSGMTPRNLRRYRQRSPTFDILPGLLCLGDERLRAHEARLPEEVSSEPPVRAYEPIPPWCSA